jgi:hypothetical protein
MTPDELPADMEGRLTAVANRREAGAIREAHDFVTPTHREDYAARVLKSAECFVSYTDLRALLKAYQEQRRALERMQLESDPIKLRAIARAALNQKGDER